MPGFNDNEWLKTLRYYTGNHTSGGNAIKVIADLSTSSAIIGTVSINQTTPGTTNFVQNKEMPDTTSTFSITPYASTALEASAVVKASAGNLYGFVAANNNAALRYVMVFNLTALPANGTVPTIPGLPISASGGVLPFDTGKFGNYFNTGIVIALSTTQFSLTLAGADALFYVQYK